jgi:hypothetical protein
VLSAFISDHLRLPYRPMPPEDSDPSAPLEYESSGASALGPGEQVWWEESPATPLPAGPQYVGPLLWTSGLALAAGAAIAVFKPSPAAFATWFLVAPVFVGLIALVCWTEHRSQNRRASTTLYRVTDRRILAVVGPKRGDLAATAHDELLGFTRMTSPGDDAASDFLLRVAARDTNEIAAHAFQRVRDASALSRLLTSLPARSGRRARLRRGCARGTTSMPRSAVNHDEVPPDVALLDDEAVLWTGRPRVWERIDTRWVWGKVRFVLWLLLPTAGVMAWFGMLGERAATIHWAFVVFAGIWLALGLHGLLIRPFVDALRRARTRYVLTDVRAITVHTSPRRRRIESAFLDLASAANFSEYDDGTGDVTLTNPYVHFERIADARGVYARLNAALVAAGTSPGGAMPDPKPRVPETR